MLGAVISISCLAGPNAAGRLQTRDAGTMKRLMIGIMIGGLFGAAGGFAAAIFVYPFIFLADIEAHEQVADAATKQVIAAGQFIHADPSDSIHHGKGSVTVYSDLVHLGPDFQVGPGPKFHVYLVPIGPVTPATEVSKSMYVDLGRLRAFKGSQIFPVPAGLELAEYKSVVIWCEQFGVLISPATLTFR